jgi:hypothetical protein
LGGRPDFKSGRNRQHEDIFDFGFGFDKLSRAAIFDWPIVGRSRQRAMYVREVAPSKKAPEGWRTPRRWRDQLDVPLQVFDFSPVITIFHIFSPVFHPISQPEGFDFSPVTQKNRDKRFRGKKMKCEVNANRSLIGNSGSHEIGGCEIFHSKEVRLSRVVPGAIFDARAQRRSFRTGNRRRGERRGKPAR